MMYNSKNICEGSMIVYFDNAASTKVRDEAVDAMLRVMQNDYGNPSSAHSLGLRAAGELAAARKSVADALGAETDEVYFTSGGTESANWAVFGLAEACMRRGKHIITSAVEHDAVYMSAKKLEDMGWIVTYLMPDSAGRITADSFASALREDTAFASIMHVNNETGAENPVSEYSKEIKRRKLETLLHMDAVQSFCKISFTVKSLGADMLTISAHKIHGPKGVGALYVKNGINLPPLLFGGGHERGKRSGTEALPSIAGFGAAAHLCRLEMKNTAALVRNLRDLAVNRLKAEIPEALIIGEGDSPFLLSISLPGHKSEVLMSFLDGEGICVSKSAACKKGSRSRVLEAMRLKNDVIDGAIRVSFSRTNTHGEVEYFVNALKRASASLIKAPR